MNHQGTKTIETERLILRKITERDIPLAFKNWTNDEKVTEFLTWLPHGDIYVTDELFKSWIEKYESNSYYHWVIELKEINEPIGTINGHNINDKVCSLGIGYCIASNWWGKGIVTEALSALLKFFFEEVGANRIEAVHDPLNIGSGRVMEKCGMKYEGTLRQAYRCNKGIIDARVYSILAKEYLGALEL